MGQTNGTTTTDTTTTALALRQPASLGAYEPRSPQEAYELAKHYAQSRLLGALGNNADAVLLIMATGSDLGISATTALRSIHIIEGKPTLSADLMVALVKRSGLAEYFRCVESTPERATYETKRKGDVVQRCTWTLEQAKVAGLVKAGGNYTKHPATMLRHRAAAELARQEYSDVTLGLYCEEEGDEIRASARPVAPAPLQAVPAPDPAPEVQDAVIVEPEPAQEVPAPDPVEARIAEYRAWIARASLDELPQVPAGVEREPEAVRARIKAAIKAEYAARKAALAQEVANG